MYVAGHGEPLLLIPGIHGRWEWMRPAVHALSRRLRVATYSLPGEPEDVPPFSARSFDDLVRQGLNAMTRAGMRRATVCGTSYGGLIAAALAARAPDRVSALVLVSALPPDFEPDERMRRCAAHPLLMAPVFLAGAPGRALPEIRTARPHDWLRCALGMGVEALRAPQSPARMAQRLQLLDGLDLATEYRRIAAPTLILTGDDHLDRVVPPVLSRRYLNLVPDAVCERCSQTGHFGLVTRPDEFARRVERFLERRGSHRLDRADAADVQPTRDSAHAETRDSSPGVPGATAPDAVRPAPYASDAPAEASSIESTRP